MMSPTCGLWFPRPALVLAGSPTGSLRAVGIAAAVLAALAILAGAAALAVSAASRQVRQPGHRGEPRQRPGGALRLLSVTPPSGARAGGEASVRIEVMRGTSPDSSRYADPVSFVGSSR
jgi:hypothetical protein